MFRFCMVSFVEGGTQYPYLSRDDSIKKGDLVVVPTGHGVIEKVRELPVVDVSFMGLENLQFPIEKLRCIKKA